MALTGEAVRMRRFTMTRWREGYDVTEVDALLVHAAAALDALASGRTSGPSCTGESVRSARFAATRLRPGYDQDEVDDFLDLLAAALDDSSAASRRSGASSTGPWRLGTEDEQKTPSAAPRPLGLLLHVVGFAGGGMTVGVALDVLDTALLWTGIGLMATDLVGNLVLLRRQANPARGATTPGLPASRPPSS